MKNEVTVSTAYYATGQWLATPRTYQANFSVKEDRLSFSGNVDVSSNCYTTIFRAQPNPHDLNPRSLPSMINDVHWLQAPIPQKLQSRLQTITNNSGKFLVFIPKNVVDKMWDIFKNAYEEGKLGYGLQCSTACPSPIAKKKDRNVNSLIVVYVQNSFNLKELGKIAANIYELLGFRESRLRFLTDRGTRKRDYSLIPKAGRPEKYNKRLQEGNNESKFLYTITSSSLSQQDFAAQFEADNLKVAQKRLELLERRNLKKFPTVLPENVLLKIFSHLGLEDIARAGRVCKDWNRITEDDALWRPVLEKVSNSSVDGEYTTGSKRTFFFSNITKEQQFISYKKFPPVGRTFIGTEWLYRLGISTFEKVYKELTYMPVIYRYPKGEGLALKRVITELLAKDQFKELMAVMWNLPMNLAEFALEQSAAIACKLEDKNQLAERTKEIVKWIIKRDLYVSRVHYWLGWENCKKGNLDIIKDIIKSEKVRCEDAFIRQMHYQLVQRGCPSDLEKLFPQYFTKKEPTRSDVEFYTINKEYELAIALAKTHPDEAKRNKLLRIIEVQRK